MQVSSKLRKGAGIYVFYCPACESAHSYRVDMPDHPIAADDRPQWTFNGNVESPTFAPSLLLFTTFDDDDNKLPDGQRKTICHLFITDGKIIYCGDNPHKMNGMTVDLPDLPEFMRDDKYGDGAP